MARFTFQCGGPTPSLGRSWQNRFHEKAAVVDRIDSAASGLANFEADRGFRVLRLTPGFVFSLNPHWQIVGGLIYSRLLADAEDSPVVSKRIPTR